VQVGVGGMGGKPMVRAFNGDAAASVSAWAAELEGYEDLHATAAMRRDIFRKLAPRVIEEARRCAA
jgi:CO/xanthine dehydrogenase FAD-binding subunit